MRLLEYDDVEGITVTHDLLKDQVPPYAILSHTWSARSADEVTHKDIVNRKAVDKPGYQKILFCVQQAQRDGLRYSWIDTCCIDRDNNNELTEAINSMFQWYSDARICYVYLSDVLRGLSSCTEPGSRDAWERGFQSARWFFRGWTLQELLAPKSVDFFSADYERLGDRGSLEGIIGDVTRIPVAALRGKPLAEFSVIERFSWVERRTTTKEEDQSYSLIGIMGVSMPVIYGEGKQNARRRLENAISYMTKGFQFEQFSVTLSLTDVYEIRNLVGRSGELEKMRELLSSDGRRRCVVLHGLGGVGKTQLAVAFVLRYHDSYSAVLWIDAKDEKSIKSGFQKIAKYILRDHPEASRLCDLDLKGDIDTVVEAVKFWLSLPTNTRWLLVFDGHNRPQLGHERDPEAVDLRHYFPEAHQGSIIITTCSSAVRYGYRLRISKLVDLQDSLNILVNASRRQDLLKDPKAVQLAQTLDGLPLALAIAGAYLDEKPISCSDYLRYYAKSWAQLQETSPRLMSYEDRLLSSTWQSSFSQIQRQNSLSANLVLLWAYFNHDDLWYELLSPPLEVLDIPQWLRNLTVDELTFHRHMQLLCDYGLVEQHVDKHVDDDDDVPRSPGYSMHACVHSWARSVLNPERNIEHAETALFCIAAHLPATEQEIAWNRLDSHVKTCVQDFEMHHSLQAEDRFTLRCLGVLYLSQGALVKAIDMFRCAVRWCDEFLGYDELPTLHATYNLGLLYLKQLNPVDAERMCEHTLQGYEKLLGPYNDLTLHNIHEMGNVFLHQRKMVDAERMYQRVLKIHEESGRVKMPFRLGENNVGVFYHLPMLLAAHNLGLVYHLQGRMQEAKDLYQQALDGFELALGPNHTVTHETRHKLRSLHSTDYTPSYVYQVYNHYLQSYETTVVLRSLPVLQMCPEPGEVELIEGESDADR